MTDEITPVLPQQACTVCGEDVIFVSPDGYGGKIYGYNCTAEVRLVAGQPPRVIKSCPDINRVGRAEPVLSDASVTRERKARARKAAVVIPAPADRAAYLASFLLQPSANGNGGILRVRVDGTLHIEVDGLEDGFVLPTGATDSLLQVLNTRKAMGCRNG